MTIPNERGHISPATPGAGRAVGTASTVVARLALIALPAGVMPRHEANFTLFHNYSTAPTVRSTSLRRSSTHTPKLFLGRVYFAGASKSRWDYVSAVLRDSCTQNLVLLTIMPQDWNADY
jgi:hypothetical protein